MDVIVKMLQFFVLVSFSWIFLLIQKGKWVDILSCHASKLNSAGKKVVLKPICDAESRRNQENCFSNFMWLLWIVVMFLEITFPSGYKAMMPGFFSLTISAYIIEFTVLGMARIQQQDYKIKDWLPEETMCWAYLEIRLIEKLVGKKEYQSTCLFESTKKN